MHKNLLHIKKFLPNSTALRNYAGCEGGGAKKGLVLGVYDGCSPGEFKMTETTSRFNDETDGKLAALLKGAEIALGKAQVFGNLHPEYPTVAVAGLGPELAGVNDEEGRDECKEFVRMAAGAGARALQERGMTLIFVEGMTNAEAAAEGAILGVWNFQEYRTSEDKMPLAKVELFEDPNREGWNRGKVKAENQNIARWLEEMPGNMMTPTIFAQKALDLLCPCDVAVEVRDKNWMELQKMTALVQMGKGSCEPPLFLEIGSCAANMEDKPVIMIGKGITFDTGGLFLKRCKGMDGHRADMAGAAVTLGVVKTAAQMNLPINLSGYIPLCENLVGGMAMKPGDIIQGLNGSTIRIDDTDNEGRVIATDAILYSQLVNPCLIIHLGTMSMGVRKGLGSGPTPLWTDSHVVWSEFEKSGSDTGDRVWRLPMWKYFFKGISSHTSVDLSNAVNNNFADPCVAAAFLKSFVPKDVDFAHLDITGTGMMSTGIGVPYLRKGLMTGRPTRTIVQFLYQMACPHERGVDCGP